MRTAGIICEYNPFHLGHQHQIRETRRLLGANTVIVCLMSGNYVQRGEPALYDKWTRAEAAVRGGADLVLELPLTTAVNAAGYFASGAVGYLEKLGCIDYLSFGSECGDLAALQRAAEALDAPGFEERLRQKLAEGVSYAAARTLALEALGGDGELLKSPNNTLGIEYLRGLRNMGSTIKPLTVQRESSCLSAGQIREDFKARGMLTGTPEEAFYGEIAAHTMERGERAMLAVLRTLPDEAFENMAFDAEGLFSKVMKACRKENSIENIIMACKSKRYAYSRLRRTLLCLYLGLDKATMEMESPYLRVLAFNDLGRQVLRQAGEAYTLVSGAVPKTREAKAYFALEQRATDLYGLFTDKEVPESYGREQAHRPVIVEFCRKPSERSW